MHHRDRKTRCVSNNEGSFRASFRDERRTAVGGVGVYQVAVQGKLAREDRPQCVRSMNLDHHRCGCSVREIGVRLVIDCAPRCYSKFGRTLNALDDTIYGNELTTRNIFSK